MNYCRVNAESRASKQAKQAKPSPGKQESSLGGGVTSSGAVGTKGSQPWLARSPDAAVCARALTAALVLYDHLHPIGAFHPHAPVPVRVTHRFTRRISPLLHRISLITDCEIYRIIFARFNICNQPSVHFLLLNVSFLSIF